jgi:hypothetical protein
MNQRLNWAFLVGVLLAVTNVPACLSGRDSSPPPAELEASTGTVGLSLQVAPGVSIGQVAWVIHNPTLLPSDRTGTVDVSQTPVIQFVVGGLRAGSGYLITLTAPTSNGLNCLGSAPFSIASGATTSAMVNMICRGGSADAGGTGSVNVGGTATVANCAAVSSLSASPSEVDVGGVVSLAAQGVDSMGNTADVVFSWAVSGGTGSGTFSDTASATPTFTCTSVGPVTVTVTANAAPDAGGASGCTGNTASVALTCLATDGGTPDATTGGCGPCASPFECCNGVCSNPQDDFLNCGGCGHACTGATPYCDHGACGTPPCSSTTCGAGTVCCGTECCAAGTICCDVPEPITVPHCVTPVNGTCPLGCPTCI